MAFFRNDTICRMIISFIFTYTCLTNEKGNWDDSQTVSPTLWKNLRGKLAYLISVGTDWLTPIDGVLKNKLNYEFQM